MPLGTCWRLMDTRGPGGPGTSCPLSSGCSRFEIQAEGEPRCLTQAMCHRLALGARRSVPPKQDVGEGLTPPENRDTPPKSQEQGREAGTRHSV